MKVKVSEATKNQLNWMVAKCIYPHGSDEWLSCISAQEHYCTDWSQGGPLLSEEGISRTTDHSGLWIAYWTDGYTEGDAGKLWMQCDKSELVAGLRCYVASKLGEEVEVPNELA